MSAPVDVLSAGGVRRARLADARLYLVMEARQHPDDLAQFLDEVLAAGVDIVQLREKEAEAGDLIRWAHLFKEAADRYGALFIVNDRPDVALAVEADGVHLGQNDVPAAVARRIIGDDMLIGISTHAEAEYAGVPAEADYITAGPVHETPTKPGRPATGTEFVRFAAERSRASLESRPWFAVGGIGLGTLPAVVEAGAVRIVVVRAITDSTDPATAVRRLIEILPPNP
jgi:thiamine-phosphate pyrophosphorylase